MKLIVGLGNPGKEYEKTRHNAGFLALDELIGQIQDLRFKIQDGFKYEDKFDAEMMGGEIKGEKVIFVKPQTFMNNSGEAVKKIADFYKISPSDIIIIHDDLDIPFGEVKVKTGGSSAGHNGVQSVIDHLGTEAFRRVKIGIGRPTEGISADKYVLQPFSGEEQAELVAILGEASKQISKSANKLVSQ